MSNAVVSRVLATGNGAAARALFAASLSLLVSGAGRWSVDCTLVGQR